MLDHMSREDRGDAFQIDLRIMTHPRLAVWVLKMDLIGPGLGCLQGPVDVLLQIPIGSLHSLSTQQ
jgi:hypothetical protein